MGELITSTHLMLVAAIALILFGRNKLPDSVRGWAQVSADSKMEAGEQLFMDHNRRIHYAAFSLRKSKLFSRNADVANPMRSNERLFK
jgi:hypothetical protein